MHPMITQQPLIHLKNLSQRMQNTLSPDVLDPCKAGRAGVSIAPLSIIQ